ncbi:MAG: SBBP repeat-containing protein [Candidatus Saganbacteria bacterium]|nr:SBBP repeat-containing protein [Candidatus Saganbacteria bacterium]
MGTVTAGNNLDLSKWLETYKPKGQSVYKGAAKKYSYSKSASKAKVVANRSRGALGLMFGCDSRSVVGASDAQPKGDVDRKDQSGFKNSCPITVKWTRTHAGGQGKAIAVDSSGNSYVTGKMRDVAWRWNIWTTKYDPNGKTLWTKTKNSGSTTANLGGNGIDIDGGGNVYVSGTLNLGKDGVWAGKYDTNGKLLWSQATQINVHGFSYTDNETDLAVDKAGNFSVTTNKSFDIWTSKYDTKANLLWTQTYSGPSWSASYNSGKAVAVDKAGNSYVTGYASVYGSGAWKDWNIWTRKYDPNGKTLWTSTHNGNSPKPDKPDDIGYGIAVDNSNGNVYVVGTHNGAMHPSGYGGDIWLGKYDPNGKTLWTRSYAGSVNRSDEGRGVAVDKKRNVYVIGSTTVPDSLTPLKSNIWIRKYDSNGKTLCTQTYDSGSDDYGTGIAVDKAGDVYVTGTSDRSIFVRKYKQIEIK